MTDTSKTDNPANSNDLSQDQNPSVPFETPEIKGVNVVDPYTQNNSEAKPDGQPFGGGDSEIPISSSVPSMIIPGNKSRAPKWFYIIFILTLIIFIAVTVLLVMSVIQKSNSANIAVPTVSPVATKAVISPTIFLLPVIEATDAGTLKISQVSGSDEIKDIENDIKTTDFSPIEAGLSTLDGEVGFKTSL